MCKIIKIVPMSLEDAKRAAEIQAEYEMASKRRESQMAFFQTKYCPETLRDAPESSVCYRVIDGCLVFRDASDLK